LPPGRDHIPLAGSFPRWTRAYSGLFDLVAVVGVSLVLALVVGVGVYRTTTEAAALGIADDDGGDDDDDDDRREVVENEEAIRCCCCCC